jgi:ADP-ribose pyrophosphatase YjhB (NUDIX family)
MDIEKILIEETRERIISKMEKEKENFKVEPKKHAERPILTVDAIVLNEDSEILLIKRKNPPPGWALPGGLVDYGETVETAVVRELLEETCVTANAISFFKVYSEPTRDPRFHAISIVYNIQEWRGIPKAADDAKEVGFFTLDDIFQLDLQGNIAFDHRDIITDFFQA